MGARVCTYHCLGVPPSTRSTPHDCKSTTIEPLRTPEYPFRTPLRTR